MVEQQSAAVPEDRPERKSGIAYVRETEVYNLARLGSDALREAQHLACEVHAQAFKAHIAQEGRQSGSQVDLTEAYQRTQDALVLTRVGENYLLMLRDVIADCRNDPEGNGLPF